MIFLSKLIIVFLIVSCSAFGFDELTSKLNLEDSQKKFTKLKFGINVNATDTVDLDLGENYDLPGPPPGGLHAYFRIFNPRLIETTSSYIDYRSFPASRGDSVVFTLNTYYVVDYLKFKWAPFNSDQVDSAYIEDRYGAGIKIDMMKTSEAIVDNPSIVKYTIKIWYSDVITSVDDYTEDLKIFPNPAKDFISINSKLTGSEFCVYNSNGLIISKGMIEKENCKIDLSNCSQGLYYLVIKYFNHIYFRKFVIIN